MLSAYTFESFVTGPSNQSAYAAALAVAGTPGKAHNPLLLYGGPGVGKSHLMSAIARRVRSGAPALNVLQTTARDLEDEFLSSLRAAQPKGFFACYPSVDVLLVDDLQSFAGQLHMQHEFCLLLGSFCRSGKQVVLGSSAPPGALPELSRGFGQAFKRGYMTELHYPDHQTGAEILRKKVQAGNLEVPDEVLGFIARLTGDVREMLGALTRVSALAELEKVPVTLPLARVALSDFAGAAHKAYVTSQQVLEAASEAFGVSVDDIRGRSMRRQVVVARQVAMFLLRQLTDLSYPAIACEFGRDYVQAIRAEREISSLLGCNYQVHKQVSALSTDLSVAARARY